MEEVNGFAELVLVEVAELINRESVVVFLSFIKEFYHVEVELCGLLQVLDLLLFLLQVLPLLVLFFL